MHGRTRKVARAIRVVAPTPRYGQPQWGQAGDATTGPIPVAQILNGPALWYLWNAGGVVEDQADRDLGGTGASVGTLKMLRIALVS